MRPSVDWNGLLPAMTTSFDPRLEVDHRFMASHARWLVENGCRTVIVLGSLGEGSTLDRSERIAVVENCAEALEGRAPVVASVSALATSEAVSFARAAAERGAAGLMLLPPYVYRGDRREIRSYFSAVLGATDLPCLLYNNPLAYGTDVLPDQIEELAREHSTLRAVKESSADVRRITRLVDLLGERLEITVGVDDAVVEGVAAGAAGWVAGLANALPAESAALLESARRGEHARTQEMYRWFLPLLRLDTEAKFVQLIKIVQNEVGRGNPRVRPPRLELSVDELSQWLPMIRNVLARRPTVPTPP